ncbi:hypothetical protein [Hydrogenophaga sp. PAMC20947]|uniref:hypothetical protein n=1 Tax=Hydrogenophaga sp. PAMC20947 TaxID=2565558 RepID=UPI001FF962A1|nr:hypothetical protein [Hydrogenophaga sp. PAMC20947]
MKTSAPLSGFGRNSMDEPRIKRRAWRGRLGVTEVPHAVVAVITAQQEHALVPRQGKSAAHREVLGKIQ